MSHYRRARVAGGTYFFTLVTHWRRPWLGDPGACALLSGAMRGVRAAQPFETIAMVILPDHLHCIWRLPAGDSDFPMRWKRIKQRTTSALARSGFGAGPFWQPRYWEHLLRDEADLDAHVTYIHFNPVKHGYVERPCDWRESTIHRYVRRGWIERGWAEAPGIAVPE